MRSKVRDGSVSDRDHNIQLPIRQHPEACGFILKQRHGVAVGEPFAGDGSADVGVVGGAGDDVAVEPLRRRLRVGSESEQPGLAVGR